MHSNNPSQHNAERTFSIVIPAWNESKHIEHSVRTACAAIESQRYTGEVIVVDNNSSDNTASIAKQAGARVVFEPFNQIARARNTGAKASTADWLIFVDADTTFKAELLNATIQTLATETSIGGGSTVSFDSELTGIAKFTVKSWNWWSTHVRAAAGCYIFCSREAFNAVGGFDEKQFAAEELYFSKNLRQLAKRQKKQFTIFTQYPVLTSARKFQWYSNSQKLKQILLLLIPGSTRSKNRLGVWYDRSNIDNDK